MRIAIICHFTNKEIQNKIKPIRKINEYAPWVAYLLNEFVKYPEHEFLIVSPHEWLTKDVKFKDKNIQFYFFRWGIPFCGRHWPSFLNIDLITNYALNKFKVKKTISEFKPDIINLIGAENPYYSSTILQFYNKIPAIITIQGYYRRGLQNLKRNKYVNYRVDLEEEILTKFIHFFVRTREMKQYLEEINPKASFSMVSFPIPFEKYEVGLIEKKYDFVFFARVDQNKGIFDYLEAIRGIAKTNPKVKALVIGPCKQKMRDYISSFVQTYSLKDNIEHLGFLETQTDLFKKVKEARISVLPTYNDLISGTIIESMFLSIPVITYRTGSIPEVNSSGENIVICEQGNKVELERNMQELMHDNIKRDRLSKAGKKWVTKRYNNDDTMREYFSALNYVLEKRC